MQDFESWIQELENIYKEHGINNILDQTGEECWEEVYNEGYTPEEAFDEDCEI